jgi:hypothetical protein
LEVGTHDCAFNHEVDRTLFRTGTLRLCQEDP